MCGVLGCLCVRVVRAREGFVSDRQPPALTVSPSHPINSPEQLISAILLGPKANFPFSALPLAESVWPHILQRAE